MLYHLPRGTEQKTNYISRTFLVRRKGKKTETTPSMFNVAENGEDMLVPMKTTTWRPWDSTRIGFGAGTLHNKNIGKSDQREVQDIP